jgi:hypothetical protein
VRWGVRSRFMPKRIASSSPRRTHCRRASSFIWPRDTFMNLGTACRLSPTKRAPCATAPPSKDGVLLAAERARRKLAGADRRSRHCRPPRGWASCPPFSRTRWGPSITSSARPMGSNPAGGAAQRSAQASTSFVQRQHCAFAESDGRASLVAASSISESLEGDMASQQLSAATSPSVPPQPPVQRRD